MLLSGATALYIGNQSYSKAYVGDTLVWPATPPTPPTPTTGYTLTKISSISQLSKGDSYVLISNKILGGRPYPDIWYNLDFPGFSGSGTYSALPTYTLELTKENDNALYTNSGSTEYIIRLYAEDNNTMYLTRYNGYTIRLKEYNGGVAAYGDATSTSGGFAAYLSSMGSEPGCIRNNENYLYYVYKLTYNW